MHHIGTVTAGSTVSSLSFSSIPQTYSHLHVRVWGKATFNFGGSGLSVILSFTGNTAPFHRHRLWGTGSLVASQALSDAFGSVGTIPDGTTASEVWGVTIFDIPDYRSTTKHKTLRYIGGFDRNGSGEVSIGSSLGGGGAISDLSFGTDGNWVAGTRIDLYGVTTNPIATGA